ncbi:MAG: phospholipase D family protein [Burkholderiaceae bacterium]|nr:phospholipase D family protein [Burkholderiaceae bacterium]
MSEAFARIRALLLSPRWLALAQRGLAIVRRKPAPRTPALTLCLLAPALVSCASLPAPQPRPAQRAFDRPESTSLGRIVAAAAPDAHSSGVRLLVSGEDALGSLVTLARRAERSLDLEYYIVRNDASARTLLREVHAAAVRGVRVRMLVDDLNTAGSDESLLCLTQHSNVELRLFNPFPAGRFSTYTRILASLTDLDRINQRMHGKMFVADNAIAATGGRNLGDAYFVRSPTSNFVDLDVLVAGPAVRRLSASFDRFWNDPLAYPVAQVMHETPHCRGPVSESPQQETNAQGETVEAPDSTPVPPSALARELKAGHLKMRWDDVRVLADTPAKITGNGAAAPASASIADDVARLLGSAQTELILITPYFVPGEHGVALIRALRQRNVRVRVLTNSLASTDAPVVHVGYARYRPQLLEMGIELYELRNQLGTPRSQLGRFGSSLASLHAKAVVVDGKTVLIGSMNLDPRSQHLNTEMGVVIPDTVVAGKVVRLFDDVTSNSSYRVIEDDGRLRWVGGSPKVPDAEGSEPGASAGLHALMWLLRPFAPEEML